MKYVISKDARKRATALAAAIEELEKADSAVYAVSRLYDDDEDLSTGPITDLVDTCARRLTLLLAHESNFLIGAECNNECEKEGTVTKIDDYRNTSGETFVFLDGKTRHGYPRSFTLQDMGPEDYFSYPGEAAYGAQAIARLFRLRNIEAVIKSAVKEPA